MSRPSCKKQLRVTPTTGLLSTKIDSNNVESLQNTLQIVTAEGIHGGRGFEVAVFRIKPGDSTP